MVRRKGNPFVAKQRRLPHKAFIRRDEPFRRVDRVEIEAMCRRIADGESGYITYAGCRGAENGCLVIGFATPEQSQAMQAWIEQSGIAQRPPPKPALNAGVLRVGGTRGE